MSTKRLNEQGTIRAKISRLEEGSSFEEKKPLEESALKVEFFSKPEPGTRVFTPEGERATVIESKRWRGDPDMVPIQYDSKLVWDAVDWTNLSPIGEPTKEIEAGCRVVAFQELASPPGWAEGSMSVGDIGEVDAIDDTTGLIEVYLDQCYAPTGDGKKWVYNLGELVRIDADPI